MSTIQERTFVYAIGTEDGPVKFGITSNLLARLRALQNGSAAKLELIWVHTCENRDKALSFEQSIHEIAQPRLEGEWFDIDAVTAMQHLEMEIEERHNMSLACAHVGKALCPFPPPQIITVDFLRDRILGPDADDALSAAMSS
jgi:predicted GIY-YIG superfamily endonuclease